MLRVVRLFSSPAQDQTNLDYAATFLLYPTPALVLGPTTSAISSLLFTYAYNVASRLTKRDDDGDEKELQSAVLYVCARHKMQHQLPLLPPEIKINSTYMNRIQMKYFEDSDKLCFFLANIHLMPQPPVLLIFDDISSIAEKDLANVARIFAFIKDAAAHLASIVDNFICIVSETVEGEQTQRLLSMYKRWFPTTLLIKGQAQQFTLEVACVQTEQGKGEDIWHAKVAYELSPNHIYFRGLDFDRKLLALLEAQQEEAMEEEQDVAAPMDVQG
jgi:hypothetical protein